MKRHLLPKPWSWYRSDLPFWIHSTFGAPKVQRICHTHGNCFCMSGGCMPPPPQPVSWIPSQEHLINLVNRTVIFEVRFLCFIHLNPPGPLLLSPALTVITHIQINQQKCINCLDVGCSGWLEWHMAKNVILLISHYVTVLMLDIFNSNDWSFKSCHFGSGVDWCCLDEVEVLPWYRFR